MSVFFPPVYSVWSEPGWMRRGPRAGRQRALASRPRGDAAEPLSPSAPPRGDGEKEEPGKY